VVLLTSWLESISYPFLAAKALAMPTDSCMDSFQKVRHVGSYAVSGVKTANV